MPQRILVVDDEQAVSDLLAYNLRRASYEVITAADGHAALEMAESHHPDLILLDLMLPGIEGLDVCRELRKTSAVPIIMITALGEEIDRVVGLELGADDYIPKPFGVREVLARVKAVLRRAAAPGPKDGDLRASLCGPGELRVEVETRQVRVGATPLHLTHLEFDVLQLLLTNAGRVLSRERLLQQAWGYDFVGDTRAVDSLLKRLRAKLRMANPAADSIEAVRGVGYRLKP